jgi:Zn-finger nucleic acid-binding protein
MNCPKCLEPMAQLTFNEVQVDRCPQCGGLYLDATELNRLLHARGAESLDSGALTRGHDLGEGPARFCPRCVEQGHRARMITLVDADELDARFDRCPDCGGSFFDAGRFQALKHHVITDFAQNLPMPDPVAKGA